MQALVEPRTPPHHLLDAVAPAGPSPSPTTLEQLAAMV